MRYKKERQKEDKENRCTLTYLNIYIYKNPQLENKIKIETEESLLVVCGRNCLE